MTTPPLDLTAHDLAAIRIIAEGTSRGDTMRIKNTAVLRLLDRVELWEDRAGEAAGKYIDATARAEAAEKKIAAVEALHTKDDRECAICRDAYGDYVHYPCPTITALDTHTPETETP